MSALHWRPASGPDVARRRAERLAAARRFFAERNILEVDVPALSAAATSDPNIDSLEVRAALQRDRALYLATSPEYAMKRLLAAGYPDVFAIARVFRDGELGRRHEPEFTLIEWYRRGFDIDQMARETADLIAAVLERPLPTRQLSYRDAFIEAAAVDPFTDSVAALGRIAGVDKALAERLGNDRDAWLDLVLSTVVAPTFATDTLTIVTHYPASQAALARLDPNDASAALRFEVFLGPLELANGYVELRDASVQRERFAREVEHRRQSGQHTPPLDEALLLALDQGPLPDCAGVAVGFERLHMLYEGTDSIRDVITFSFGQTHD